MLRFYLGILPRVLCFDDGRDCARCPVDMDAAGMLLDSEPWVYTHEDPHP